MNSLGISTTSTPTGGIVVGVDDSVAGHEAVRAAALSAAGAGTVLHLVAAYEQRDERRVRATAPHGTARRTRSRSEAELMVKDAARQVAGLGVVTCEHVYEGALHAGVRKFARILGAAPAGPRERPAVAPPPPDAGRRTTEQRQTGPAPWLAITRTAEPRTAPMI